MRRRSDRRVADQAATDLDAVEAEHAHAVAAPEVAADLDDPRRQQALAVLGERAAGAVVDHHDAGGLARVGDPVLARADGAAGGDPGPHRLAVEHALEHARLGAARDHGRGAGKRGLARRLELGHHAAEADLAARGPGAAQVRRRELGEELVALGAGVAARIGRVEAVDVGEQHQELGLDQVGDQRRQPIVVAELDLVDGDGVVLVHHRQHAELEQRRDRVARVGEAAPVGDVLGGEQDLRDLLARGREMRGVGAQQRGLARRGGRLLDRDGAGAVLEPELTATRRHRARGHQHHVEPAAASREELAAQRRDGGVVELTARRQHLRADLDHQPADLLEVGRARVHARSRARRLTTGT